jgi:hypothetical protein
MTRATISGIQAAIATLFGGNGLHTYPTMPKPNSWVFPALAVTEYSRGEPEDFQGTAEWTFVLLLVARETDPLRGQVVLAPYLDPAGASPSSLEGLLNADPSIGGTVQFAWLDPSSSQLGTVDLDGVDYLGARLQLKAWI